MVLCFTLPSLVQAQVIDSTRINQQRRMSEQEAMSRQSGGAQQMPQQGGQQKKEDKNKIHFTANDSLVFDFSKQRIATLFGSAKVQQSQGSLSAGKIALNLDAHTMSATAENTQDTLSHPVLTRGNETVRSDKIIFNYQTGRGKFNVARVKVSQGNLIGMQVKNKTPHVIFIKNAIYSTCNLPHPHFYIKAKRMKVINDKEIFFTNARLYILDIPYPLILPFGYVPAKIDRKQSGLLSPTYSFQQQQTRGLGLQNLGWFQYFNDHLTGLFRFGIYTSGTFNADAQVQYAKTNQYNGSIELGYSVDRGLEPTDPGYSPSVQKKVNISHNQRLSPYANLNASINFVTSNYYNRNSYNINDRASVSTTSRIAYSYNQPDNLYNFNVSISQSQNFSNNSASISGPSMGFSLRPLSPFQSQNDQNNKWYNSISLSYQNNFRSQFSYTPLAGDSSKVNWFQALTHPSLYRRETGQKQPINFGFIQNGSISVQFLPQSFVHLSGGINMNEYWYPETIREHYNPTTKQVETNYVKGFVAAHQFSTSLSLNTRLYGIWNQHIGDLYGFRHTLVPTISFSYQPDFSSPFWGTYRTVQTDSAGDTSKYPIFQNNVIGGPSAGQIQSISFSLNNILETKQVKRDTTGEKKEKVIKLINNLSASAGYNFAAKHFKLSNLNTSFNTSIINNVNINANANFSFYQTDSTGSIIDKYLWQKGGGGKFLRMTSFSLNAGTSLHGGKGGGARFTTPENYYYPAHYDPYNQTWFHTFDPAFNTMPVQPFNVPWSVSLSFSFSWNKSGNHINRSAVINAQSITMNPTPNWQLSTSLGYDFIQKKLTPSQFRISRQLHLWNLNFTFNPFGGFKYYLFSLTLNSGQFQSLLQKLPLLNYLEQSNSPISRNSSSSFGGY